MTAVERRAPPKTEVHIAVLLLLLHSIIVYETFKKTVKKVFNHPTPIRPQIFYIKHYTLHNG